MNVDASGTLDQLRCEVCGARVSTLRRGRCWGCYQKWQDTQPVALGASCVICGERRKENLQRVELFGRWYNMCHICAVRTHRLNPMPKAIEGIRQRLQRDRRYGDRRGDNRDSRIMNKERRVGERRAEAIEEGDIVWMEDAPDIVVEAKDGEEEAAAITSLFDKEDAEFLFDDEENEEVLEFSSEKEAVAQNAERS